MKGRLTFLAVIIMFFLLTGSATAADYNKQQQLIDKARITIDSFVADPNLEWFRNNVKNAKGLLIVPELLKGGFVLGGSGGRGVLLIQDEATGEWSYPAFYGLGSVSLGLQIGGKISEVVMMVMTQKGLESLYTSSFKIGGDLSIAAGPIGATAEGATAPSMNVDYLSFARSKGAFAGISLDGAVVKTNGEWNNAYYGKPVQPTDIFVIRSVSNADADALRHAVFKATRGESREREEGNTKGVDQEMQIEKIREDYHKE